MWRVGLIISWLTQGYLLCPDLLLWHLLLPNLYHFGCLRKNNYKKIHTNTSLLLGWTICPHQFLVAPDCSIPLMGRDHSLPSKSCSCSSPDRRFFKTLSWGQTVFTSHQVKQLLKRRGHLWMSDQRILRYQVVLMENPGLAISPYEVLNHATLLPNP